MNWKQKAKSNLEWLVPELWYGGFRATNGVGRGLLWLSTILSRVRQLTGFVANLRPQARVNGV